MSDDPKPAELSKFRVPPPPSLGGGFPSPQPVENTEVAPNPLTATPGEPGVQPPHPATTEVAEAPGANGVAVKPPDATTGTPEPTDTDTTQPRTTSSETEAGTPDASAGNEPPAAERSGAKKPPALPRPQRLGASKSGSDFRDAPHPVPSSSSGTSSVPKGIKPPTSVSAVPGEIDSEDTDVLIASVADAMALEAEQDAARAAAERAADEHDRREREAAAAAASSGIASSTAAPSTANEAASLTSAAVDDDDVGFGQPRPTWIPWAAVGGVVAIVLFAFFAWPSDEPQADAQAEVDTPVEPEPKTEDSSLASAEVQPEEPTPVVAPPEEPAEPQEAAAAIPDLGGGDMDEPVELEGEADSADEAGAESEGSPDGAEAEALDNDTQDTKKSSSNRRSKPRSRNKSIDEAPKPDPLPNREPKQEGGDSAPELLSQAKSQLARGRAPEAYRLASASYAKRRSTAALQVMAKAGCRMGNQSKAKRAFDKLSVTERSGIRSECRKHGVKLGL